MSTTTQHTAWLEAAADNYAKARQRRDDRIVAARADGVPLRVIADAVGLAHQTVQNIVDRHAEAARS